MGKCKFKADWLLKKDNNDCLISAWASKSSENQVFCKLCVCNIFVLNKGVHALLQHADTDKHKSLVKTVLEPKQMILMAVPPNSSNTGDDVSNPVPSHIKLYSQRNASTVAELIWTMKSVCHNLSASSCDGIKETFNAMFPGSVPEDFSLSRKKMRYLISDALFPYFQEMVRNDVGMSFYTICFDETSNVADKKELQIIVRYWSETNGKIVSRHLQTFFIGKADAQTLYDKIHSAINNAGLQLEKLLMIGSDGPNVNKKVHRLFNDALIGIRSHGLIDIGTCPIHIVHNAYLKALQTFGEDASELAVAVYNYFDGWPSRVEDYEKIQEDLKLPPKKFIKHSPSRWLTFHHAAERLLEQWEGITRYFLRLIPSVKNQTVLRSQSFRKISDLLRCSSTKAEIYFTMSSAELFMGFTEAFQKDEPLIHILHIQLRELIEKLAGRVCKSVGDIYNDDLFCSTNMLPLRDIVISQEVRKELSHLSEKDSVLFRQNIKEHYVAGCKYLIEKTMNDCLLLKSLKCLNPPEIKNRKSFRDIVSVARKLPCKIKEDILIDQWKMLQLETELQLETKERIDCYWEKIFKKTNAVGEQKYYEIAKVVKATLSLSHGNAEIERRFSTSRWALTEDKAATSERTLNSIMLIKDMLKSYENKPELVPITPKLVAMGQNAHKHYVMYVEEQKRLKEEEARKKEEERRTAEEEKEKLKQVEKSREKITEIESKLSKSKLDYKKSSEASNCLFKEANDRLKSAIKKGDLTEATVAQGMLEGLLSMRESEQQKLKEVEVLQRTVEKRKNNLITSFFNKKPRVV